MSKRTLHKYINELVSSSMSWLPIKVQLQERFSECGSATMAKHMLTQLKQLDMLMHEYIAKFGDMVEHAYSIKPTDGACQILASNFIEEVQNPHVKNKLRYYQIKKLKGIFGHAIHEDQKQKIRALYFRVNSKPKSILNCDSHFIKDCPLNKQDTNIPHGKYTNCKANTNTNSTPDKVMEPLFRLFNDHIEQLRLLTPLGHNPHNARTIKSRQHIMLAIGNMVQLPTINTVMPIGTTKMTKDMILTIDRKAITGTTRTLQIITGNMLQSPTPEYMRSSHVANVILSFQLPLILRNTWLRKMFLHQTCQKLVCSSQDLNVAPENLRGSAFHEKVVHLILHILQILVLRLKLSILEESLTMSAL